METTVSQAIFFAAGLVAAAVLAASLTTGVGEVAGGIEQHSALAARELRSDIRVVSDPVKVPNNPVKLLVMNTGAKTLLPKQFTVLVDGLPRPAADVTVDVLDHADDGVLGPGQVAQLTIANLNLAAGDHVAKVVADTGVGDTFSFRI